MKDITTSFLSLSFSHLLSVTLFLKKFPLSLAARIPLARPTASSSVREEFSSARHESTIGASNISLEDRRRVTSLEMRKLIRTRHKFRHRQAELLSRLVHPPPPAHRSAVSRPFFPGAALDRPLLNLRPINQTSPYKFVTREIARILARACASLSLIPSRRKALARYQPLPSSSVRFYRRFHAHF